MELKDMLMKAVDMGSEMKFKVLIDNADYECKEISYIELGNFLVCNHQNIENVKIKMRVE